MTDIGHPGRVGPLSRLIERFHAWRLDKIASPDFQRWAAKFRLTRPFARHDSERLYDLVAGFVYSQTLLACTELGVLETLRNSPQSAEALGDRNDLPADRMRTLCQAASAIGLMVRLPDDTYRLGNLGAAAVGVPGLDRMIRHHKVFFRDLADPVALLRRETDTELSRFWPYVMGEAEARDHEIAAEYSDLMATSQELVAEETLDAVPLTGIARLLDVGGGTGVFLENVAARYPEMELHLMDLPAVIDAARGRLPASTRITMTGGSFLDDRLPAGADGISLIRVLYDHDDPTVEMLLGRVFDALPPGGRVIVSEPMSGGSRPSRAGDAYFGFYTMAMTTGRPRSAAQHLELLSAAGFTGLRAHSTARPFLTSAVSGRKPEV
ncbi:MAG: methyltransferase [Pseudomonadota bacterium]